MGEFFTVNHPMPPLWLMYSHIHRYGIGWRMGYGKEYKYKFFDWFKTLSDEEQNQYRRMFPEPNIWRGFYDGAEPEDET